MEKSRSVSFGVSAPFPGSWYAQGSVCALQESVSQSRVSSSTSMVGIMVTSSKRAYAITRSTASRAPAPSVVHCWPAPPQETFKYNLSQSLWGRWILEHTRNVWVHWACLEGIKFDSKCDFIPSTTLLELLRCFRMWGISSQSFQSHATAT